MVSEEINETLIRNCYQQRLHIYSEILVLKMSNISSSKILKTYQFNKYKKDRVIGGDHTVDCHWKMLKKKS